MRNINRLLENAKRSDLHGYNIYTMGRYPVTEADYDAPTAEKWLPPALGLPGAVAIGYEIDKTDLLGLTLSLDGIPLTLRAVRHRWTPAYSDTYYRADPTGEYAPAGRLVIRERKCFTADDTFLSHLTLLSDDACGHTVELSVSVPFSPLSEGLYRAEANVVVAGLRHKPKLSGYVAAGTSLPGPLATVSLLPQGRAELALGLAFSRDTAEAATAALEAALAMPDPFSEAEERFNRWMQENAPRLECDNTDLLKVYYYRFFLIKCAIHTPADVLCDPVFPARAVYESPFGGWFGCPIGLPIPLQLEEMRWMRTDAAAADHIAAWCRGLGNTQNYIQYTPMAILRYYRHRADGRVSEAIYRACRAFTLKKCDPTTPEALPVTVGSWQTGAEYQPSFYQYTEPAWNFLCDTEGIRLGLADAARDLHRADECSFHVANLMACRDMARSLGMAEEASRFADAAERAREAMLRTLWSEDACFFFDYDRGAQALCDRAPGYAGFLPLLFGIAGDAYAPALAHLGEERFSAGLTLPTAAKDCPMYWFDSHIVRGGGASLHAPHRYPTAWNGPIWPFATSLVLEALGGAARRDARFRGDFLRLFAEYTELHFLGGDRTLPCTVEHYRVSDGYPLSPYADYFHSKWIDLFLSYWAGIGYADGRVSFTPLTKEDFVIDGVILGGVAYRFESKTEEGRRVTSVIAL